MIGTEVQGYRIERALSEDKGGFGDVYFARHVQSGAEAVLKVLKPEMSAHRDIVTRFFNEARAAASIQHPGIVQVHNVGYLGDRAYLLMERLRGEDLETRLSRGPLAIDVALRFLRQAAGAIGAAHDRGIVHRDLKPANLFIVPDPDVVGGERIKVLDFGIAKLESSGSGSTMKTQGIFGTPAYMAPEQCASAADVDARSDLYALGCILFEMIAGRPPFGYGGIELIAAHLRDEPPALRTVVPHAPPALEALVATLLRKRREERPPSCKALVAAIETLGPFTTLPPAGALVATVHAPATTTLGGAAGSLSSTTPPPRKRSPLLVIAAVAGVAVVVAGGLTLLTRPDPAEPALPVRAKAPPPDAAPPSPPDRGPPDAAPSSPPDAGSPDAAPPIVAEQAAPPPREKPTRAPTKQAANDDEVARILAGDSKPRSSADRPESLDRAMISNGVSPVKGSIAACGDRFPARGVVKLAVKVAPDGRVLDVTVRASPGPNLGQCAANQMRRARFAATQTGGSFTYPFVF